MSSQQQSISERKRRAEEIAANPHPFKVCEGCESIVTARVATCPSCHGYRFNDSSEVVSAQARLLGARERTSVIAEDLE